MLTKNKNIWKAIPVRKLKELLDDLPDDFLIHVTPVNELGILDPGETQVGYISISGETRDFWDETDKE